MADEVGGYRRAASPGLDGLLDIGVVELVDFLEQLQIDERAFFE
jgi:hypothetical protein